MAVVLVINKMKLGLIARASSKGSLLLLFVLLLVFFPISTIGSGLGPDVRVKDFHGEVIVLKGFFVWGVFDKGHI